MWYMRQKEEFGEDRSQGIRFYDNTQTCDYLPHWHMTYEVIMVCLLYTSDAADE